ncbi:MAG TPA: hypothetical protein VIY48_00035 [Candidatus Paceibacterota bacterium]
MESMNPEVKALWIAALESGEYEQGVGYLKAFREGGKPHYCCLGVLCDLAVKAGVVGECSEVLSAISDFSFIKFDRSSAVLPESVMTWAGLHTAEGQFAESVEYHGGSWGKSANNLANLNDDAGFNFQQIAGVIKKQF